MKRLSILFCLLSLCLTGCVSTAPRPVLPYANNPFNSTPYKPKNTPSLSPSDLARAANIGLNAASRPIAGAISPGSASGISSGLFVLNLLKNTTPRSKNGIGIKMPVSEAKNIEEARDIIVATLTKAILSALPTGFTVKKVTYDDRIKDKPIEREWYLVNGPSCEAWSCQLIPLLDQRRVDLKPAKEIEIDQNSQRYLFGADKKISFVKITNDFIDEDGDFRFRVIEGVEIPNFDYPAFYLAISKQMPKWAWMIYLNDDKYIFSYQGKTFPFIGSEKLPFEIQ